MRRIPATIALVALNVAAFVAATLAGVPLLGPSPESVSPWGTNVGPLTAGGEPWRTITSVFAHFGVLHLAVNMIALADLGRTAERLYGSGPFLLIALASGAVGAAVSVAWNPWVHSAGASGAVFGLLGALLAYATAPAMRGSPPALRGPVLVLMGFVALSFAASTAGISVDHAAHLGGFACGAMLGRLLAQPSAAPRPPLAAGRLGIALSAAALAFGTAAVTWRDVAPAHAAEQRFVAEVRTHLDAEGRRNAALRESFHRWRAGETPASAHAQELLDYAAALRDTAARLESLALSAESPSNPIAARDAFSAVLRLRARGMERRAEAVRTGHREAARDAERWVAEADALWEEAACRAPKSVLLRCATRREPPPGSPR